MSKALAWWLISCVAGIVLAWYDGGIEIAVNAFLMLTIITGIVRLVIHHDASERNNNESSDL